VNGQPAGNQNGNGAWLPLHDVERALGLNRSQVMQLLEEDEIEGAVDLRSPGASRSLIRVPRDTVTAFLEKRQTTGKLRSKRARISPTKMRRRPRPAAALLAMLRQS
jgi:hypothetical protein